MRGFKNVILLLLLVAGIFYVFQDRLITENTVTSLDLLSKSTQTTMEPKTSPASITSVSRIEGDLYKWIGKQQSELESSLGEPLRRNLSSYGYVWWVYTNRIDQYIQFGIKDNQIVTIFATGDGLSIDPISIGQSYDENDKNFEFDNEVSFSRASTSYRFKLTTNDMETRPLAQIDTDTFIQFYFDSFAQSLSSIRIVNSEVLLTQRPYEIFYRGELPEAPLLTSVQWREVETGMEQQIFDITNIFRTRFNRTLLEWDDSAAGVALGHSKDMAENNYFSHYTQTGDGLKERLSANEIYYLSAGENIAAQYTDGPSAVEGWLNSEGHRDALLKNDYTHLGVGVYKYYYTQNFLQK
ncbi:hypothetical protein GH741_04420 [Aquibacillus halophilus]|uniref:CAP domain-containing protein n=1 Tax=Aquibacillus halophilus TaxID=930132 RepID=A0A6A8D8K1_9BACI|nr:CAP domain-containing protein [Aquibacillus halophilus]MRH41918.1 hypothetical protein [Aquibacillus halophilus]